MTIWRQDKTYLDWYRNPDYPEVFIRPDLNGGYHRWEIVWVSNGPRKGTVAQPKKFDVLGRYRLLTDAKKLWHKNIHGGHSGGRHD